MERSYRMAAFCISILLVSALPAIADSASVYLDAVGDSTTLYTVVNTADGPQDCGHSGHSTEAWLSGPTGYASGSQSGFYHGVSLPLAEGDYTEGGSLSFTCGCWGSYTSPGATQGVKIATTVFSDPTYVGGGVCRYANTACSAGTPSCSTTPHDNLGGSSTCPNHLRVFFVVIQGRCYEPGIAYGEGGPGVCS